MSEMALEGGRWGKRGEKGSCCSSGVIFNSCVIQVLNSHNNNNDKKKV